MIKKTKILYIAETDGIVVTKLLHSNGGTSRLVCPKHTKEEQNKILDNFVVACAKMLYPAEVVDNAKSITLTA